ncbi:glycoside hydrolase family 3 C-terminal domain-containing protein [Mucilaginibacter sp. BJC16-A38]|uniref:glycoside hydrolase family 3 N-terminal domain-containing protein n=1 Tax=Mucilaginibacter phenanthrenivorans TaxID=1234842 RepID=UPI0021572DEB|nr:glycoside hydrolase family 3 N-terminal domain-containing protein [Mucilaginibacter phenanthrenivorans]MCR8556852.1 glycoside hydrolase family 3 C-terminal domain-containing protein [Mucilaginibacter phenanthrenivorans]
MKRIFIVAGIVCLNAMLLSAQSKKSQLLVSELDKKVDALIAKMTLEEKVGQMTEVTSDVVSTTTNGVHQIDDAKIKEAILKYHVGSILNVSGHAYDRKHWFDVISTIQKEAAQDRLKIPVIYGIDAIHGVTYTTGSTLFPHEIAMAATFNKELAYKAGEITAYETRASYIPWNYSPVLDLGKSPLWPRIYETFGEDPFLIKTMGASIIKGYQGNDVGDKYHVAACMKHYLGYGDPIDGKDRTPAWIPDRYMREYFLPPFAEAVKAGAKTLMINSGEINGVPIHASKYMLTDVLRGELHFDGIAVTDWRDIEYLHDRHHIAATQKDAVMIAVNAGVDMSMVPYEYSFYNYLVELVHEGKVSMARINEAVHRILKVKYQLGLFERPVGNPDDYPKFGSDEFKQISVQAATEAITLLKNNNNILPLKKDVKVFVTGPTANTMRSLDGGWSYTWQGDQSDSFAANKNTILEAIQQKIGKDNVSYEPGASFDSLQNVNDAVKAAKKADVIVLCLGELSYTENVGNIDDLNLPAAQIELATELTKTGKPVILVLAEGRPRVVTQAENQSAATVMTYLSGNEGGDALASILFGDANPSGKLPFTYPKYPNALVNYYRKNLENGNSDDSHGYNPLYEFGFGLSYTTFSYNNLHLSKPDLKDGETLLVTVDVKNTGQREGKESVLLYTSQLYASIAPDTKRLRAYDKINLKPGEKKTVTFKIKASDLAFVNDISKTVTEPGEFKIQIGDQTQSFNFISNTVPSRTGKL